MLLIPCPWCGPRNQLEFSYGGDASLRRPAPDAPESAWTDYVYLRDNPRGPHDELWLHAGGCRQWLVVRRDTRTHDITGSRSARGSAIDTKSDTAREAAPRATRNTTGDAAT